jgi:hypothetical protein
MYFITEQEIQYSCFVVVVIFQAKKSCLRPLDLREISFLGIYKIKIW